MQSINSKLKNSFFLPPLTYLSIHPSYIHWVPTRCCLLLDNVGVSQLPFWWNSIQKLQKINSLFSPGPWLLKGTDNNLHIFLKSKEPPRYAAMWSVHFNKLLNWDELLELLVGYERHKNNKTGLIHTRDCSIWNIINRLIQLSQSGINHECATYMRGKVINQRASLSWRGLHWSWEGGLNTQQTVTEEVEKSRWSQRTREGWEVLLARYVETGGKEDRYHHVLGGQNKVCRKRARVSILGI